MLLHMFLRALKLLLPITCKAEVSESGMSPLHSAAAGGHAQCLEVTRWLLPLPFPPFLLQLASLSSPQVLLEAGYDPNYMLQPWVRRSYDDERKSALFFAVSNNDLTSARLLLEAGAMTNQDPVKCLQVPACLRGYACYTDQNIQPTCKDGVLVGPHNVHRRYLHAKLSFYTGCVCVCVPQLTFTVENALNI